jgi:quercetin dioxygenase-like cupin family protein
MEAPAKTIENPVSGEKITIRRIVMESGNEILKGEIHLAPRGCGPPEHIHPIIEERFKIRSGALSAKVNGKVNKYTVGQEIVILPGVPHRWWNDTDTEIVMDFIVQPALRLDKFLESVFALAQYGKTDDKGLPGLLQMSVIIQKYWDVVYLAKPPLLVQKIVLSVLSVLGRVLGCRSEYIYPYDK